MSFRKSSPSATRSVPDSLPADVADSRLPPGDTLDVRPERDFQVGHLGSAIHCPLDEIPRSLHRLAPRDAALWIFGDDDEIERAMTLLRERGFSNLKPHPATAPGAAPSEPVLAPWVGGEARVRLWRPNAFLAEILRERELDAGLAPSPEPRRALDVACGSGRDSCYLALAGFGVTGVDVLPDALTRAASLAAETARSVPALVEPRWVQADLERSWPFPSASFDLVHCARFLWRPRWPDLAAALRPGGHLIYETFTVAQARHGKPAHPDHLLEPGELARAFEAAGLIVARYRERDSESGPALASLWARREA